MTRCGLPFMLAIWLVVGCAPAQHATLPARAPAPPPEPEPSFELTREPAESDPIELRRVADRDGALGLLARAKDGSATALAALPYAEDAELALADLCALSARSTGAALDAVLVAVHGVATRLPPDRERLAAESLSACTRRLAAIEADRAVRPHLRDLAASARQALAEHLAPEGRP